MQDVTERDEILWVLRNARTHALNPRLRSASGFAQGGGVVPAVHRAQVGRWENGSVDATYELVRRYEMVLGLPEGQLLCAIDCFARTRIPVRTTARLSPRGTPDVDETLSLLERALAPTPMTGLCWDRLSDNLGRMPQALVRSTDWEHLFVRCTREMAVSLGLAFTQRDEAVDRLAGHPRSGPVLAELAANLLNDPDAPLYNDIVGLLQYTTHPAAIEVLLGQLREPTNDHSLRACLIALTTLLRGGQLGAPTTTEAARLAIAHLRDGSWSFRVQRGAANLIRALDLPANRQLALGLSAENRAMAASIILDGRAQGATSLNGVKRRIGRSLDQSLSSGTADPVLRSLLRRATVETNEETRSNALAILMISPQGRIVGRAYAAELAAAVTAGNRVAWHECLSVLTWLGQPEDLELFTELALTASDGDLAYEASLVLGNCLDEDLDLSAQRESRVSRAAEALLRGSLAVGAEGETRLRGLAYVLGLRGRFDLLAHLVDVAAQEGKAATAASRSLERWLGLPLHLRPRSGTPCHGPAADG